MSHRPHAPARPAVIIATCSRDGYDDSRYLDEAIDSVRTQTVPTRVIVADCSPPERHIPLTFHPSVGSVIRVRGAWRSVDPGVCEAIQRGVLEAGPGCEWIVPLNADDTIAPTFVEECLAAAMVHRSPAKREVVLLSDAPLSEAIVRDNYVSYCCLARREWWMAFPGFRKVIDAGGPTDPLADWDLWVRVWQQYGERAPVAYARPALLTHREREDSAFKQWGMERVLAMRSEMWAKRGVAL